MIDVHGVVSLSAGYYALVLAATTGITLALLYRMLTRLRRARWIEDTPTSRIRSAAQGLVELKGHLGSGGHTPLVSPLGEIDCLWYRFRVEEYRRSGKNSQWRTVEQGCSERPFLLGDDTGSCWIAPQGAEVHPSRVRRWEGHRRWPAGHALRTGILAGLIGKRYRYTEEWLEDGQLLYALGWFQSHGGGREIIDQHSIARQVIGQWKADYDDLLARFDRDRDGELDMPEWEKVRLAADREAGRQVRARSQAPSVHELGKAPHRGLPFILSDHHEEHLSRRLRRQSFWSLMGLVVSAGITGWLWLAMAG
ncbi:GIDE domain-containing protein [Halopseudomonas sp.]|uniref:GIDE domain-containing protein n=1 Tax=Halopseudomonas sp. TaxID=2901191 RepID=UPI00356499B5